MVVLTKYNIANQIFTKKNPTCRLFSSPVTFIVLYLIFWYTLTRVQTVCVPGQPWYEAISHAIGTGQFVEVCSADSTFQCRTYFHYSIPILCVHVGEYPANNNNHNTNHRLTGETREKSTPPPNLDPGKLATAWHNTRRMIFVKYNPKTNLPSGFWPIPESFWPDYNTSTLVSVDYCTLQLLSFLASWLLGFQLDVYHVVLS